MSLKFYFDRKDYALQTDVFIVDEKEDGTRLLAKPMNLCFEEMKESLKHKPSLSFSGPMGREFLPKLAQGLAEYGYRPRSDDAQELKATKYHLEDMRKMVFKNEV